MTKSENGRERPPLFPSWGWWYAVVLMNLALQILLFYLLTRAVR